MLPCTGRTRISESFPDGAADFGVAAVGEGIDQAHVEGGLSAVAGNLEHVVDGGIDPRTLEPLRALYQSLDISFEFRGRT